MQLVVVHLHDERDLVRVLPRHRAEHAERRGHRVAAALDRELDDVLRDRSTAGSARTTRRPSARCPGRPGGSTRSRCRRAGRRRRAAAGCAAPAPGGRCRPRPGRRSRGPGRCRSSFGIPFETWLRSESASSPSSEAISIRESYATHSADQPDPADAPEPRRVRSARADACRVPTCSSPADRAASASRPPGSRSTAARGSRWSPGRADVLDEAAAALRAAGGQVAVAAADVADAAQVDVAVVGAHRRARSGRRRDLLRGSGPARLLRAARSGAVPPDDGRELLRHRQRRARGRARDDRAPRAAASWACRRRPGWSACSATPRTRRRSSRCAGSSSRCAASSLPYGIHVGCSFPPDTDTPQLADENRYKPKETKAISGTIKPLSAERVAKSIVEGIEKERFAIIPDASTQGLGARSPGSRPVSSRRVMDRSVRKVRRARCRDLGDDLVDRRVAAGGVDAAHRRLRPVREAPRQPTRAGFSLRVRTTPRTLDCPRSRDRVGVTRSLRVSGSRSAPDPGHVMSHPTR